jgi:predicted transcriptional regulator
LVDGVARTGIAMDMELYEEICDGPVLSCYEFAKKTGRSEGRACRSLKRLTRVNYVTLEKIPGRTKRLVYPMNWAELSKGKPKKKC